MDIGEDAKTWFERGVWALDELSRPDADNRDALAAFDKAISLKPDYAEAWFAKSLALKALNRRDEARAAEDEAFRIGDNYYHAYESNAQLLTRLGRFAEAAFIKGCWWLCLSGTADHLSDQRSELEQALAAFDTAARLKPDYSQAWLQKARVLAELGRHIEAEAAFATLLGLEPDDREAVMAQAVALPSEMKLRLEAKLREQK